MNKLILLTSVAAIMTLGIASKSWAVTCDTGKKVCQTGCIDESLTCNSCGSTCGYTQIGGVVTLYGTGTIASGYEPGASPFAYSTSITSITADATSNFTSISDYAFHQSKSIKNVVLPNVTSIGNWAFGGNSLESVGMPNVTTIGLGAFYGASSLQSVDMPNVTSIGEDAFRNANKLQSVNMPNVTSIGDWVFLGASSLTNIIISDDVNVNNWSANAFGSAFTNNADSIITCLGDVNTCKAELEKKYGSSIVSKVQPATEAQCNNSVNYYYNDGCVKLPNSQSSCEGAEFYWVSDKCTKTAPTTPSGGDIGDSQESEQQGSQVSGQATSAADCKNNGQYWQEEKCVSSCGPSFKLNDGWCDRQRYTPAEAAPLLNDDNTNEVTITFRK